MRIGHESGIGNGNGTRVLRGRGVVLVLDK